MSQHSRTPPPPPTPAPVVHGGFWVPPPTPVFHGLWFMGLGYRVIGCRVQDFRSDPLGSLVHGGFI